MRAFISPTPFEQAWGGALGAGGGRVAFTGGRPLFCESAAGVGSGIVARVGVGKEWTTVEPDSEIKLVPKSQGALPVLAFYAKLGFWAGL